ncbi:hypothetical protein CSA56_18465 [candidate division KSB3 bacterium]|uniref:J domain-containing protein n=1 Tax=candidate division KSB3 bacterium TaxID=2044937 RepID=A0A2G6K6N3_9BACT|nr:MAG: hypothetical protein CSA56_18465 [candidate division KSB3 bacterium]
MYGFLRVKNCQLTNEQKIEYKKFYCGQCHALHDLFGYTSKLFVSYDATLFGLLIAAQRPLQCREKTSWCGAFPYKVPLYAPNEITQRISACFALLIFSLKLSDGLQEKKSPIKAIIAQYYQRRIEKAKRILQEFGFPITAFQKTLDRQYEIESSQKQHIECYAEPSATFLAEVFRFTATVTNTKEHESTLFELGYHIGKTIYLIDSCVDIVDDIEKEQFNALLAAYQQHNGIIPESSRNELVNIVIASLNTIRSLTASLHFLHHQPLIQNILCSGFPQHIYRQIQRSIKQVEKHHPIPLRYLPHAALTSALCVLTAQPANAGWVDGKTVIGLPSLRAYGCFCGEGCGGPDCPCEDCCGLIELFINPCVCFMDRSSGWWVNCCFQLPKTTIASVVGWTFISQYQEKVEREQAQRRREEEERQRRQREEAERRRQQQETEQKRRQEEFIQNLTKELCRFENRIYILAGKLNISFPSNYQKPIIQFVKAHSHQNLTGNTELQRLVNQQTQAARKDLNNLENSHALYQTVSNFYLEVARIVNRTGSIPLIKELEELYGKLHSPNLKSLLTQKKWNYFHEFANELNDDLEYLKQVAIKYQQGDYEEYEADGQPQDTGKMNEEKAYRILEVPSDIQNEQLKKVWKKWAEIFHPDSGYAPNEARMKEINEAYQYLQKIRGFK